MKPYAIALLILVGHCLALADDLDTIVRETSTTQQRGDAYYRAIKADFAAIAPKLLELILKHPVLTGIGPSTKEPWSEDGLIPGDRIGCTLRQIWSEFTKSSPERATHLAVFLDLLEHTPAGEERSLPITEIRVRYEFGAALGDKSLPPFANILPRLDRLVRDDMFPVTLRRQLLEILFEQADPNPYLDTAIEISKGGTKLQEAEAFRFATPTMQASRFTPENRKKYVVHCYKLLESIDDGSGTGYFLAMHVGQFLGVKPLVPYSSPFQPNQKLPEYQDNRGLKKSFFQDTVINAKKWWDEHKSEYQ
tara:strand:- start:355 stop:1275 length:921 start_codon:yes stop_codon:yes gene_type:complete